MMQPPCPVCGQPMKLMQVDPVAPGRDRRVFECKCGHSEMRDGAYR
jgi:transposase